LNTRRKRRRRINRGKEEEENKIKGGYFLVCAWKFKFLFFINFIYMEIY
jgi:hypothetical protein